MNAKFVLCSNHSQNLSGVHDSPVKAMPITFFGVIEILHILFFSSNYRWEDLSSYVKVMMKRLVTNIVEHDTKLFVL